MTKYRAKLAKVEVGYFEFEADDDYEARDHLDQVISDNSNSPETFWDYYIETGHGKRLDFYGLETWKEVDLHG